MKVGTASGGHWGASSLRLPKTPLSGRPLVNCHKCEALAEPAGAIELSPGRWRCAKCWIARPKKPPSPAAK